MKKWIVPVVVLTIFFFFLFREYQVAQISTPQIFIESELVLFRTPSAQVFGMGCFESSRAKAIVRGVLPFFSQTEVYDIWGIPVGEELIGMDFMLQRVSSGLVRLECLDRVTWWIGDDYSEKEQEMAVAAGVSFTADWWIMTKNRLPKFFPLPSQGILYAGDRAPSKKTTTFAQKKGIPLIFVKEAGGFILSFVKEEWKLKVRKKDN